MKKIHISITIAILLFISITNQTSAQIINQTLSLGSKGTEVSALQQFLKERGFFTYPEITGYFGLITQSSLIAFQKAFTIDPVGIAGPITRAKIIELLSTNPKTESITNNVIKKKSGSKSSRRREEADTTAPTVSISNITTGDYFNSSVTIDASASDNKGVVGVQFQVDGVTINSEDTESPFSTTWNIGDVDDGEYELTAVARDQAGNTATSSSVIITIDTTAPVASIVFPIPDYNYTPTNFSYTASSTDNVGIDTVFFSVSPVGSEEVIYSETSLEYPYTVTGPFIPDGDYVLTVIVTDLAGNQTEVQGNFSSVEPS